MLDAPTIVEILARRVEADGPRQALGIKRGGKYEWKTWNDLAAEIPRLVATLVELGVQPGDTVAQLSENRYEWVLADLAIHMAGAVHVPIHSTLAGPQIAWQIRHSGAKVVLVSGPAQVAKLAAIGQHAADCPGAQSLKSDIAWVSYDPCSESLAGQPIRSLTDLLAAAPIDKGIEAACHARNGGVTADSLATILYTSGTTGEPKGVMLTQANLASNAVATVQAFGSAPDKTRLNFLPLSHIFARTCDLYCWLVEGSRMAIAESRETVIADCQAVQPTYLNGVPHFYDRIYRGLADAGKRDQPGAVKALLGGAIEQCCAGGAALPDYLYDFFHGQGVPLLQGYGLSESSPVITLSTRDQTRRGSCGRAIPGVEIKIAADGEILTRGPHVMRGYYDNPAATAEVLDDGWLKTGDLGRLDDDGFLYITGRKKEILVTLGGKNIAPVLLESLLTQDPLILQAMIVGDGRPCLGALIVPNYDTLLAEAARRGLTVTTPEKIMTHREVRALFQERIDARLACVSAAEQVRCFALLPRPFTIEAGELTPKLTLRRKEIAAQYSVEIERLYR
jgi:long-chain acyl-CoA synthetase